MRRLLAVCVAVTCVLGVGSAAWAKVIRVSPKYWSVQDGPGDAWYNGYYTLGKALSVALPGDELWVHGRVYEEYVTIPSGVAVYGGFDGTETALSQRPAFPRPSPDYNTTIIDGEYINSPLVTFASGASSSTKLDGVTLRNAAYGAVCVETASNPVITNNIISKSIGSGIYIKPGAAPLITNNTISECVATRGGGIYVENSLPTITDNILRDNRAICYKTEGDLEGSGGGIYVWSCDNVTPLITNNTISGNRAYHKGGGIMVAYSNVTISGNIIHNNGVADGNSNSLYNAEQGGGIYCTDSKVVITNNTMCRNAAAFDGGAICLARDFFFSSATIYGNIFYDNQVSRGSGYAIFNKTQPSEVQLDYNDVYPSFTSCYVNVTPGPHELRVEPGFVNSYYLTPDYHLAIGSPCVNAGYSAAPGLQSTDFDGHARINGPAPDMGCYEYQMAISPLANDTPVWQTAIPGLYWFQIMNGKWAAVGIAPTVDHDLRAADNAWINPIYASSTYGGSTRDFIVANGQSFGDKTHYALVSYGEMGSYLIEADWNAVDVPSGGSTNGSVTAGEVVDVYQSTLLSGKTYQISVHITSGTPDLSLFVFNPSRTSANRYTADWASQSGVAGVDEQLYAITAEDGTYGIIIVNEDTTPGSYTVSITEKAPVTISGHIINFAGTNMARIGVQADNGGGSVSTNNGGNYTLTVPYYWSGNVSPVRSGWAFVPSSLVYSNLTDNVTGANFTGGQVTSVGGTKLLPDGRSVYLTDKPVTATFGSDAYIEDADRVGGIRVVGGATLSTSMTLGGVLATADGERRITSPVLITSGSSTVTPVYIGNKSIGGATMTYAPGIPGTTGLNNVGLLVRTSGVVTNVSGNVFYINDGSNVVDVPGTLGIRVDTGGLFSAPPIGKQVTVTGISGVWIDGITHVREIRPRSASDVWPYRIALIHGADTSRATEIHDLAESNLIYTTLIPDSQMPEANFAPFDAVLISGDSLAYQSAEAAARITNSGLPVMGIGAGGSRYFEARGLYIGWLHSATNSGPSTIVPRLTTNPIFHSPYEVYGSTITPYSVDVSAVLVYMPSVIKGVSRLASYPDPAGSYYVLCSQSRCLLWGYDNGAHQLTSSGKDLFINAIHYTLGP